MADNIYDFDALIASSTRFVTDDGSGNDTIVLSEIRTISQASIDNGNYAVRIFLTDTTGTEGRAYCELTQTDPLVYQTVTIYGVIENIFGAGGREFYSGNASRNYIQGDSFEEAGGDDHISGWAGNDTLVGAGGSDRIYGGADHDLIYGDMDPEIQGNIAWGDDTLDGGTGNDTLIGGFGNNVLIGGAGIDTANYAGFAESGYMGYAIHVNLAMARVAVLGTDFYDGITTEVASDTISEIERFVGTGAGDLMQGTNVFVLGDQVRIAFDGGGGNDTLIGGAGADELYGGAGDDVLDAGLNGNVDYIADLMVGGTGNDTYIIRDEAEIVELWNEGIDTVISDRSWRLGYNLERLVLSSAAGHAEAIGNVLDNHLIGNAGNNTLDGRGGQNTLEGGAGNDTYMVRAPGGNVMDSIIEQANGGRDTAVSHDSVMLSFFNNVENLILLGSANTNGGGNAMANRITGNSGANVLSDWGDNDTLVGGAGDDTYVISGNGTQVIEKADGGIDTMRIWRDATLAGGVENLVVDLGGLCGTGNGLNNRMTGAAGNETLLGLGGDDVLFGGSGNDLLNGGNGNDTLRADAGADTLLGGAGTDMLLMTGNVAVTVNLALTTAQATGYGMDVLQGIENVTGGNLHDVLRGNAMQNLLYGGNGGDQLFGAGGDDGLFGGAGDDVLELDAGNDTLSGGADTDLLLYTGSVALSVNLSLTVAQDTGLGLDVLSGIENIQSGTGNDVLRGNALTNDIRGGAGNDTIYGGSGQDYLYGGAGDDLLYGGKSGGTDLFIFGANDGNDRIADFEDGIDMLVMGNPAEVIIQAAGAHTLLIYDNTRVTLLNINHQLISVHDFLAP